MSHTLTISDDVYDRLTSTARRRGLSSVEELLETWQSHDDLQTRQTAVARIDALREHIFNTHGEQGDSTALLRDDRAR